VPPSSVLLSPCRNYQPSYCSHAHSTMDSCDLCIHVGKKSPCPAGKASVWQWGDALLPGLLFFPVFLHSPCADLPDMGGRPVSCVPADMLCPLLANWAPACSHQDSVFLPPSSQILQVRLKAYGPQATFLHLVPLDTSSRDASTHTLLHVPLALPTKVKLMFKPFWGSPRTPHPRS
jgi:hypothetical protein